MTSHKITSILLMSNYLHWGVETSPSGGQDTEGILHHTTGPGCAVVKYVVVMRQEPMWVGFHHPGTEWERIVPHHEVGRVSVITGEWGRRRQADGPLPQARLQGRAVVDSTVTF